LEVINKKKMEYKFAASMARSNLEYEFNRSEESALHINKSLLSEQQVTIDYFSNIKTIQFPTPMTAYFWVDNQQHNNRKTEGTSRFWKADGYKPLDDYAKLHQFLTTHIGSGESLYDDFTITCLWSEVEAKTLINGVWKYRHCEQSPEELCYVGIVFDKIELTQGDINEKLYFVRTWPSQVIYHPIHKSMIEKFKKILQKDSKTIENGSYFAKLT
jgi:hypothetical protein